MHFMKLVGAVVLVAGTSVWAQTNLTQTNNDKCSSNTVGGEREVVVRSAKLSQTCSASSGACSWSVSFPLYDLSSACVIRGGHESAYGYVTGWRVQTPNDVVSQLQHLKVLITGQSVTGVGSTKAWNATIEFAEQNQGSPSVITQDSNDVVVEIEIIALKSTNLSLATLSHNTTSAGPVTGTNTTVTTSAPLLFVALAGFDISTDRNTATTSPLGVNIKKFGVETTPAQSSGSYNIATECTLEADLTLTSQSTSCRADYIVLRGTSSYVTRVATQPTTATAGEPLLFASNVIGRTIVGSGNAGSPTCGLKTFLLSTDSTTSIPSPIGTATPEEFKQRSLGFWVPDCDAQLINGGQDAFVQAEGAIIWKDHGGSAVDQSAGLFMPVSAPYSSYEFWLVDGSPNTNSEVWFSWSMTLDSVEF